MDFISRDALVTAMHAWVLDKAKPLGGILQAQGVLSADERDALEGLVRQHLRRHSYDAGRSLAAALATRPARPDLSAVADPDIEASLAHAPSSSGTDDEATKPDLPQSERGTRYRILRPHAKGGLGQVFVAEDTELHREVALKEMLAERAETPGSRGRFLLEAEVNGRLEHPGIVPVYGLGQHTDGRPYYAMRFIQGETLKEAIRRFHDADKARPDRGKRSLALRRLLGRFVAVCNAVAYAHSRGVIHRDLKPANVMLGKYGETLVVDWGLAKLVGRTEEEASAEERTLHASSGSDAVTLAGAALGTPAYMSPEQALGRTDLVGPASDIYGLGATLYCLLTGQAPFPREDLGDLLQRVGRGEWKAPCQVKKGVPAALDAVCRKAMALKPQDRYASPLQMAVDIEHWLADEPVSARCEPLRERLGRWRRRHPALLAVAGALLLVALAFGLWLKQDADTRLVEATRQRAAVERDVSAALDDFDRLLPEDKWADARAAVERAQGRLGGGGPESLRDRVRQAQGNLDLVSRLEEARLQRTQVNDDNYDLKQADKAYMSAFQESGLGVLGLDPEDVVMRRVHTSPVRAQLVAALDDWVRLKARADSARPRLAAIARLADDDPWRQQLRDKAEHKDRQGLERLARDKGVMSQPAPSLVLMADFLRELGAWEAEEALLRRAQQRYPAEFWINHALAWSLVHRQRPVLAEAVGFYRAAAAVRPQSPGVHLNLGKALYDLGKHTDAEACFRRTLALKGDYAMAHNNLGHALNGQARYQEAEACFRQALALNEDLPMAHAGLGAALNNQHRYQEAEACCRQAVALKEDYAGAHASLGFALFGQGQYQEAEACFRQALALNAGVPEVHHILGNTLSAQGRHREGEACIRRALALKPNFPEAHNSLGNALASQRRLKEAEACFRRALALKENWPEVHHDLGRMVGNQGRHKEAEACFRRALTLREDYAPAHFSLGIALGQQARYADAERSFRRAIALKGNYPEAYCNLGQALQREGRFADSLAAYQEGHALGSKLPGWHFPSAQWVKNAERYVDLDRKLPAFLQGDVQPVDQAERLMLADLCRFKRLYTAAARLCTQALDANPTLTLGGGTRYNAACAAALAGCGQGDDAKRLPDKEQVHWRMQALAWLRADLTLWALQLERRTQESFTVQQKLTHWQHDADLAGVRDAAALNRLPEGEQQAWRAFWQEVGALLARTRGVGQPQRSRDQASARGVNSP
jgi:tetratricopeptide (TPR) repeat protein/serine/threonine protein kinase